MAGKSRKSWHSEVATKGMILGMFQMQVDLAIPYCANGRIRHLQSERKPRIGEVETCRARRKCETKDGVLRGPTRRSAHSSGKVLRRLGGGHVCKEGKIR